MYTQAELGRKRPQPRGWKRRAGTLPCGRRRGHSTDPVTLDLQRLELDGTNVRSFRPRGVRQHCSLRLLFHMIIFNDGTRRRPLTGCLPLGSGKRCHQTHQVVVHAEGLGFLQGGRDLPQVSLGDRDPTVVAGPFPQTRRTVKPETVS